MSFFYLTPASISYLNQFLLVLLITGYLGARVFVLKIQRRSKLTGLLIAFFAAVSVFSALLFLDASLLPAQQLQVVYLENTVVCIILIPLLQFAYHFPSPRPKQKIERHVALAVTIIYTMVEAGIAVWRFSLLRHGQVEYRPEYLDYAPAVEFLWVVFVFAREAFQNWGKIASRRFALIFFIPFYLAVLNVLRSFYYVSTSVYHISMSVGILFTLFLFVLNFSSSQPDATTLSAKFSGAILTSSLAVFGVIAWMVTPVYSEGYSPVISDHRTIRFSPNSMGGYSVSEIPFVFDENFGEVLPLTDSRVNPTEKIQFIFPFFNQQYRDIYISNDGVIGVGMDIDYKEYQLDFTRSPAIFPLLLDLDPEHYPDGKIHLRRESDLLVITYDHVHAFYQPDHIYTFQVLLYSNGEFSVTYNGLPENLRFHPNDRPEAAIWAIGIKPEKASSHEQVNFLNLPLESGPQGVMQDEYLAFRQYLHRLFLPLAATIFASSFILLAGIPLMVHYGLAHPLNVLLAGVEKMNKGELDVEIPVHLNDEIGYLTRSFNDLSGELKILVWDLETRVSKRTSDLLAANEQLLKLSVAVEQSPSTIVITDINANIEYVNPAFTQSTGYTFEEVRGKNPRILKSDLTSAEIYKEMWEQLTMGNSWRGELINRKKNGDIFWEYTVITPIRDVHDELTHYAAIKEDVTARVLAEEALRESEEQYRLLFDLESDAIFIIRNDDGQILEANKAATSLYGYTRGELLSLKNTNLSAEPESTKKATKTRLPSEQVTVIPVRYHRKKNGTIFPVEITARFISWEKQSVHIAAIRDITERKQIEEELVKLSITDPLTEIANRRYFYIQAEQIFNRTQVPNTLAAIMIDVDHFKQVNDRFGHAAGDAILRQLAGRLNQNLRPTDILARYGGEEFVILLPRTSSNEAKQIVERLWQAVSGKPFIFEHELIPVTISIGVAELGERVEDLDTLMRHADEALYQAKQAGRNQWVIWKNKTSGAEEI